MSNPLVSVCIPCFNAAPYIAQTLDCVLAQTWSNLEVIVVDDGSTDCSREILQTYKNRGVCVAYQANSGQCSAANHAFRLSSGDLIKFLDADDLLSSSFIQLQVSALAGTAASVASAEWGRFYGDDISSFRLNYEDVWRDMSSTDWLVEAWRFAQPMMQCGLWLVPKDILQSSGGWDESLSLINDFEFFARVLCHSERVSFASGARLYYRSGIPTSLSSLKTRAAAESAFHSILKGTAHLLARRSDSDAKLSCANVMQNFLYTFYPEHQDLLSLMHSSIVELGGANLPPPGGPSFALASRVFGWKAAKKMQRMLRRF